MLSSSSPWPPPGSPAAGRFRPARGSRASSRRPRWRSDQAPPRAAGTSRRAPLDQRPPHAPSTRAGAVIFAATFAAPCRRSRTPLSSPFRPGPRHVRGRCRASVANDVFIPQHRPEPTLGVEVRPSAVGGCGRRRGPFRPRRLRRSRRSRCFSPPDPSTGRPRRPSPAPAWMRARRGPSSAADDQAPQRQWPSGVGAQARRRPHRS